LLLPRSDKGTKLAHGAKIITVTRYEGVQFAAHLLIRRRAFDSQLQLVGPNEIVVLNVIAGITIEIVFEDIQGTRQVRRSLDAGCEQASFVGRGPRTHRKRVGFSPVAIQDVPVLPAMVVDRVLFILKKEDRVAGKEVLLRRMFRL